MKGIALAAVVAACGSNDGRIDKLETRVEVLEVENDHLSTQSDALWKAVNQLLADDMTSVANWWCIGDGACARNLVDCERFKSDQKCVSSRIAYCDSLPTNMHACLRSLALCEQLQKARCVGVE